MLRLSHSLVVLGLVLACAASCDTSETDDTAAVWEVTATIWQCDTYCYPRTNEPARVRRLEYTSCAESDTLARADDDNACDRSFQEGSLRFISTGNTTCKGSATPCSKSRAPVPVPTPNP